MDVNSLLTHLHRGGTAAYLWCNQSDKKESLWFTPGATLPAIPRRWTTGNIYFGVHPSTHHGTPHSRSTITSISAINCFFAEFDAKDFGDKNAIQQHLDDLWRNDCPWPSVIIDSGGGYHCYWLLEHTVPLDDSNRKEIAAMQAAWVGFVGGDNGAKDLARVLRLPGTLNYKYNPPRPVEIVEANDYRLYRLEDFRTNAPPPPVALPSSRSNGNAPQNRTNYAAAALANECSVLAHAPNGTRNQQLFRSAAAMGELIAAGVLNESDATHALSNAAHATGLGDGEIAATLRSGLKAGKAQPRDIKPLPVIAADHGKHGDNGSMGISPILHPDEFTQSPTPPGPLHTADEPFRLTDLGNAYRFAARHGDSFRFTAGRGWLAWDGRRWQRDAMGAVQRAAKETVIDLYAEAAAATAKAQQFLDQAKQPKLSDEQRNVLTDKAKTAGKFADAIVVWAKACQSRTRLEAIPALAASELAFVRADADFDTHSWLYNCANGTLDLRTGTLRLHNPADNLTTVSPTAYIPNALCPTWLAFLHRAMDGNQTLVDFLQRAIGYSLTGDVSEQVLFFLHGAGANGKSTFLNTILSVVGGDYAAQAAPDLLVAKSGERHPTEVADLQGKRLVASIEVEDGRRMAEGLVKQLTGGDVIKARLMRQDFFQFWPTHKLFLAANHKPTVRGTDYAIWRRIRLIPFNVTIPENERDPHLPEKLRAEGPGILAWAVRGCLAWQRTRLQAPVEVVAATEEYRRESDTLGAFLDECTVKVTQARTSASELYGAYMEWSKAGNLHCQNIKRFGDAMTERGYEREKQRTGWFYVGIGLMTAG